MTRLGKLAVGALLMAGTAVGGTAALTTPASAGVYVGVGVPSPYYGYYGYPYYGYPYYGGPYVGIGWGGGWGWRGGCCWGGWHGGWGYRGGWGGYRGGWGRGGWGGWHGGGFHGGGFHGPSAIGHIGGRR